MLCFYSVRKIMIAAGFRTVIWVSNLRQPITVYYFIVIGFVIANFDLVLVDILQLSFQKYVIVWELI